MKTFFFSVLFPLTLSVSAMAETPTAVPTPKNPVQIANPIPASSPIQIREILGKLIENYENGSANKVSITLLPEIVVSNIDGCDAFLNTAVCEQALKSGAIAAELSYTSSDRWNGWITVVYRPANGLIQNFEDVAFDGNF